MKKRLALTTAVLTVGGIGLASSPAWAEDQNAAQPQQQAAPAAGQPAAGQPAAGQPAASDAQTAGSKSDQSQASQADVRQALSQTANAAVTKGGLSDVSKQVCQKSQQRLGDLSQQGQQLDQSIDQLKQAYKDKYQQDLDLSRNTDAVFTAEFFQIGGAGDQARQASARQGPDAANSNAANDDAAKSAAGAAAGAAASGDQAQVAKGTMMDRTIVIIPESHGVPEARVAMVKEDGQWKIALPAECDGKQLSQNLQQHVQEAIQQKDQWGTDAADGQRAIVHHILIAFAKPSTSAAGASDGTSDANPSSGAKSDTGNSGAGASGASKTPGQ
jgi:hypothetical protein